MIDILISMAALYGLLVIIKLCLVIPSIPYAINILSRLMQRKRFGIAPALLVIIGVPVMTLFGVIGALREEGWRFFIAYTDYALRRTIVREWRNAKQAEALEQQG